MTYEKDGIVSIWVGNLTSQDTVDQYLQEQYENDDLPLSRFAADFDIPTYDHDFLEVYHKAAGDCSIQTMLAGFSCSSSYIGYAVERARGLKIEEANTVILLLDFAYTSRRDVSSSPLIFLGTFAYDPTAPPVEEPI